MVHHTCALTQAHKHEGQVLQPETAAFRDLVRGGISDKERKESMLQGGQEGRPRKASVKVKCHSAASSEPKCKGGGRLARKAGAKTGHGRGSSPYKGEGHVGSL